MDTFNGFETNYIDYHADSMLFPNFLITKLYYKIISNKSFV